MASGCLRHKGIKDQGLRCQIDFQPRLYNLHFHLCACCGWFRSTWEQRLSQWVRNRAKATGKVLQKVKGSKHRSTEACEKSSTKEWNPRVVHISESHRKSHCNNAGKCPGTQRRSLCLHLSTPLVRRNSAEKRSQVIPLAARDPRCLGNGRRGRWRDEWTTSQEMSRGTGRRAFQTTWSTCGRLEQRNHRNSSVARVDFGLQFACICQN